MAKPDGLDRLLRQLRSMPAAIKQAAAASVLDQANTLAGKIQAAAPRDTGALAASVKVVQGAKPGAISEAKREAGLSLTITAGGPEAPHARWVEFGTAPGVRGDRVTNASGRTRKVARTHPGTKAQPFFYPTIRAQKKPLKAKMTRALNKAVKAAAGGSKP